jgi:4-amino-4-deoxy-L-arabinose transferase-like glycosyltransferase
MRALEWIDSLGERQWLLGLAVVAVILRIGWVGLMVERQPRFDETAYIGHALRLARGEGYVDEEKRKVAYWPVGYPLSLAAAYRLTGTSRGTAVGLQIGIGTLTCLLLYLLGKKTFGTSIARLGSLLLAIYPNQVFFSSLYLTEPLFTLLLLGAFAFLLRSLSGGVWARVAAGVLLGFAILTRPAIILLPLALPLLYVGQGWRLRHALGASIIVVGSTLATISPWMLRNHQISGRWTDISTSGGDNFWVGNNPSALGGYGRPKDIYAPLRDGTEINWQRGYRLGWTTIREAPWSAVIRSFQKVTYFFALETDGVVWNLKGLQRPVPLLWTLVLLLVANTAYILVLSTGLLGLLSPPRPSAMTSLFILLSAYLVGITVVFFGDPRYHFPLIPLLVLFSSKALLADWPRLLTAFRQGEIWSKGRIFVWAATMSLFVLMMAGNLWLKYLELQRY